MNTNLFKHYYQNQLNTMETNPQLRDSIRAKLATQVPVIKTKQQVKHTWLAMSSVSAACAVLVVGFGLYSQPKTVTADALLQRALAAPELQVGEIYQASFKSSTDTAEGVLSDYQTTISDGSNLERISYDADHHITGAELAIPAGEDNTAYNVYSYGEMRQFQSDDALNIIQHRTVINLDTVPNVTSDDPTTFSNVPEGWNDQFGKTSILEIVSGSSFWRPYLSNESKQVTFFAEPTITETTLNGKPVYQLDERQDDIGFHVMGWISKQDGRLLQEQTVASDTIAGVLTVYDAPVITVGTMPTTVTEFMQSLHLTNAEVTDYSFDDFQEYDLDTIIIDEGSPGLPAPNCAPQP